MTESLPYLAGIFDAGASFQVRRRKQRGNLFYAVRMVISVPNPQIARMFQRKFGGALEVARNEQASRRKHGILRWYSREDIDNILTTLKPHSKHEKLEAMLDFLDCPCNEHMTIVMSRVNPWP